MNEKNTKEWKYLFSFKEEKIKIKEMVDYSFFFFQLVKRIGSSVWTKCNDE